VIRSRLETRTRFRVVDVSERRRTPRPVPAERRTFVPLGTLAGLALTDEQPGILLLR